MTQAEVDAIAKRLTDGYGLELEGSPGKNEIGQFLDFWPLDADASETFTIRAQFRWRSLEVSLSPGSFSGQLVADMGASGEYKRKLFCELARQVASATSQVRVLINGSEVSLDSYGSWPPVWKSFSLSLLRTPLDTTDNEIMSDALWRGVGSILSLAMLLMPMEEIEAESSGDCAGLPEGAKTRVEVNRYERSRVNRAMCIQAKGSACAVCGVRLEDVYGELGRDFIHVHHVTPVSQVGEDYRVDPIKDLAPVCPNCHAMIHRKTPPLSLGEIKALIDRRQSQSQLPQSQQMQ